MLPYVHLHTNTIISMLPEESQPCFYRLRIGILNLYQAPKCDSLKVLLAFFKNEITPRDGPALRNPGKGNWP